MNRVDISENISWVMQKGSWMTHILLTLVIKLSVTQFVDEKTGLQLTLIFYNLFTFYFFHWKVGDPFSNEFYNCTFWEQIIEQSADNVNVKFLSLYPYILFILANKVTTWNSVLLYIYITTLLMITVPKLKFMHLKRIFGLRRGN